MEHSPFGLIATVLSSEDSQQAAAWRRFKKEVWDRPCWVAGSTSERGGTNFIFHECDGDGLPRLKMFANEQHAREQVDAGALIAVPFRYAIYLLNDKQYDLDCYFDAHLLSVTHAKLLAIRDLAMLEAQVPRMPRRWDRLMGVLRRMRRERF